MPFLRVFPWKGYHAAFFTLRNSLNAIVVFLSFAKVASNCSEDLSHKE